MTDTKTQMNSRGEAGQALVELALTLPILLALLVGVAEFGRFAYFAIEVANAAHAGVQYGAQNNQLASASNTATIQNYATYDAPDVSNMTATASVYCVCSGSASHSTCNPKPCSQFVEYVQVNTSATVSPIFQYPGISKTLTLTGQAIMRVEQ